MERMHIEQSRTMGILLHSVIKTNPGQWAELLPLAEFVIWGSPGATGLAPRDLVMSWSLASPLELSLIHI